MTIYCLRLIECFDFDDMKIGFALITEQAFLEDVVCLEQSFHDRAGFADRLGTVGNLPHITVFQGDFDPETDYRMLADGVADDFLRLFPDRRVEFRGVEYISKGWYFLICDKTDAFVELHSSLLDKIRPFINVTPFIATDQVDDLSEEQELGIRNYGYRYAGQAYYPHITLGRSSGFDSEVLKEINDNLNGMPDWATISRITVYRMGNNGTHSETLYEIELR